MDTPNHAREPHEPFGCLSRVVRIEPFPDRLLVLTTRDRWAKRVGAVCASMKTRFLQCATASQAEDALWVEAPSASSEITRSFVLVIDRDFPDAERLIASARRIYAEIVLSVCGAGVDDAVWGIQMHIGDLVEREATTNPELIERFSGAAKRSRNLREQRQHVFVLSGLCRRPFTTRANFARQPFPSCSDAVQAYQEIAPHMQQVNTATEFTGLIKGELDIEALLRTTLEFVLARSGPTNAAVFLPTTSGDYSLGAYVNYDCPKDTCDVLLDHLANVIAPKFERTVGLVHLTNQEQLDNYIADEADWLTGSHVAGFACRNQGEVLAIFMLFRDQRSPFTTSLLEQVKTVGELFAAQLARVIHIHHRHLPKEKWGMLGDPEKREDDYGDLAA
jgi:GAF domain-containing protein